MMIDNDSVKYAAIIIPTLCRFDHLKRCIESLQNNSYAKYSDIYIGLDYPTQDKYIDGNRKIESFLNSGIKGFANVKIIKHTSNLGAEGNMSYMIEKVMEKYDTFIFSEDDNEFSPNYLEYMNKALWKYQNDENVVAVSGYNYPMNVEISKANVYRSNTYFAAFGFGTWSKKFARMQDDMSVEWLHGFYNDATMMRMLKKAAPNQFCNFVKSMIGYITPIESNDIVWKMDLTYGLYMFSHNLKMIFPTVPKVKNWGYDGSGVNCKVMCYDRSKPVTHRNFDFDCQKLDSDTSTNDIVEAKDEEVIYTNATNEFFLISKKEMLKTSLAYCVSRMIGVKNIRRHIIKDC